MPPLLREPAGWLTYQMFPPGMLKRELGGFQYKGLQTVPWSPGEDWRPWDYKG